MPIRAVILDYGNVLCPMPSPEDFERLAQLSGIDGASFQQHFWRFRLEYDRGSLDGGAFWEATARAAGAILTHPHIEALIAADVSLWERIDPALLAWVGKLRASNLKTAILSNMPLDVSRHLRRTAWWLDQFDHTVFSAELGMIKPEPEIYGLCLRALNVAPADALFVDDRPANVEAAKALGIHSLRFESPRSFAKEIEVFRLPPL